MIYSDKFKFIYIRVPRTGSTSFVHYLETVFGKHIKQAGRLHASAWEIQPSYQWDEFHTFGFIRNPWEWLVSMYNANISDGAFGKEPLPGCNGNHEMHRANLEFEEWVYQRNTTPMDWLADQSGILVNEIRLFEDFIKDSRVKVGMKPHSRYQDWYTPELAEFVSKKCKREIDIGGYTF